MRLHLQPCFDRFFCQQACCQQHAGVGGIGAAGNGSNQYIAIANVQDLFALRHITDGNCRRMLVRTLQRRAVTHHLHHRAGSAQLGPWCVHGLLALSTAHTETLRQLIMRLVKPIVRRPGTEQFTEFVGDITNFDAILRTLWPRQTGCYRPQIQSHHTRVIDITRLGHTKQALGTEVRLKSLNL